MKLAIYFLIFCSSATMLYPLSYDTAVAMAQDGNISGAYDQLCKLVVNSPDKSDLLYDAGILAHQLNKSAEAAAYFVRAAQCAATDNKNLRFSAHFNAGNAYVATKKLELALDQYEKALGLDPDNEYARHNRDRVEEMLQQQQNQQNNEQQKQDDKKEDEKDNNQNDQNNQDQQQNQNDQNDQQDKQQDGNEKNNEQQKQKQGNNEQQKNNASDRQSDKQSERKQKDGGQDDSNGAQRKDQRDEQEKKADSKNDKKRDRKQNLDKKSGDKKQERDTEQSKQHDKSPEKQAGSDSKNNGVSGDAQEKGKEQDGTAGLDKIDDPLLLSVMNDQELRDKAVNRKLMGAKINQQRGKNEQNSW